MAISWSLGFGFQCFSYQIKDRETSFILRFEDLNFETQILRYEENRKKVLEREEEQSSQKLSREMLISWSSGFGFQWFSYHINAMGTGFILGFEDLNYETQILRYEENRKEVLEREKEQSSWTLCREMLTSQSPGLGFQCFSYQLKARLRF